MTEKICPKCGGTILPPSVGGAKRGTCHCPENMSSEEIKKIPTFFGQTDEYIDDQAMREFKARREN